MMDTLTRSITLDPKPVIRPLIIIGVMISATIRVRRFCRIVMIDIKSRPFRYPLAVHRVRQQRASTSFVQRHLKLGYNRAATIIEEMENNGIISAANHVGKRDVLLTDNENGGL